MQGVGLNKAKRFYGLQQETLSQTLLLIIVPIE